MVDSTSGDVLVHLSSESSLVVEVKKGQHLDPVLMELKDYVLIKMNEYFGLGGDNIRRYQDKQCVPKVEDLRIKIVQSPMVPGIRYIQVSPRCIMTVRRSIGGMA